MVNIGKFSKKCRKITKCGKNVVKLGKSRKRSKFGKESNCNCKSAKLSGIT